jgi:hypothetical protein
VFVSLHVADRCVSVARQAHRMYSLPWKNIRMKEKVCIYCYILLWYVLEGVTKCNMAVVSFVLSNDAVSKR